MATGGAADCVSRGSVYGASARHRVAVLAKSPLTLVRTPDADVQLPFVDLGSERDRSLGAELFGRVSGDHDNVPLTV
jgi:hypothetical protein